MLDNLAIAPLQEVRDRLSRLQGKREELKHQHSVLNDELTEVESFLLIADSVTEALEQLGHDVFQRQLTAVENSMTKALQEVLEQPIELKTRCDYKRDAMSVEFFIRRNGDDEHILRGQGGSVANVVSVGLRMLAIATLDGRRHRKFLVLDEQDCWLHPDLVPRLTRIVKQAGRELGFQVLMISHHNVENFLRDADKVYRLSPDRGDGVRIEEVAQDRPEEFDR